MPAATTPDAAEKLLDLHHRLAPVYGETFPFFSDKDPLSEIVSALLSHRTRNAVTGQAYRALRQRFPDWESVLEAPTAEVEAAISAVTYPEVKAPRIQQVLRLIKERNQGRLSLDFLAGLSVAEARRWLEAMPGVGAKTSAAVLNFSRLRLPALVVDTHHLRVAQRTGVVPPKMDIAAAAYRMQAMLPSDWNAQQVYDHHQLLMRHGQQVCYYQRPACERCVVRERCDYYQAVRNPRIDEV